MKYTEIGGVRIEKTAALAPMASVADRAYRQMAKEYGAAYVVGEIRVSEFFVSVHRRLFYYFIIPKDFYPQSDHTESIPQKTVFFKRFANRI